MADASKHAGRHFLFAKANPPAPAALAREWARILAKYREPSDVRSVSELLVTAIGFAFLYLRLFMIQHDCGHGAFFRGRAANDWVGRAIGTLTLTPYDVWRRSHAIHHASSGNLERRGIGMPSTILNVPGIGKLVRKGETCFRVLLGKPNCPFMHRSQPRSRLVGWYCTQPHVRFLHHGIHELTVGAPCLLDLSLGKFMRSRHCFGE